MVALPAVPTRATSFTDYSTNYPGQQQPGSQLDAEFDRLATAVSGLISFVSRSISPDGLLKSVVVEAAYQAGQSQDIVNVFNAPSKLSAELSQAWAEHLPDIIPPEALAGTMITGDHWSARYWANLCYQLSSAMGDDLAAFESSVAGAVLSGAISVLGTLQTVPLTALVPTGAQTSFNLTRADTAAAIAPSTAADLLVTVDGVVQRATTDYSTSGSTITFVAAPAADAIVDLLLFSTTDMTPTLPAALDGGTF